ncbi:19533_t:CDS:2 [Racocetra fulgida]|uniref:19533_t:CDS:1 n=1 Tax=Racocetra fulgida TaxID=60492 RepID=A0A9N9HCI0_9GLOM|nr:19533_t:CDS:2 [Racocetra fulgida]
MKKIGKLKQWANEKVGASQKTQTTDEFQELQHRTDARHSGVASIDEKTKALPIESLGIAMRVYGEELGSDSSYGTALVKLGTANEKVASCQLEHASKVREEFLESLDASIEELKQYQQMNRKLESRRLNYDAKLNKMQKSKKEKPELEEEMRAAKEKYENTKEELHKKMITINESEDQYIQELTVLLDSQLEYFKSSYEILSNLRKDWVQSRTSKNNKNSNNSQSDEHDDQNSGNESSHSHSSYNRSREPRSTARKATNYTSKNSKKDSNNLSVPNASTRNKSSGSSVKSFDSEGKQSPARRTSGSFTPKKQVKAIYSYEGDGEDELAMEEGDIITVLEEHEGWWIGEIIDDDRTRRRGMFPANYTEELPTKSSHNESNEEPPQKKPSSRNKRKFIYKLITW